MSKKFEFYIASRTSSKMHSGLAPRYLGVDSREDAKQGHQGGPDVVPEVGWMKDSG